MSNVYFFVNTIFFFSSLVKQPYRCEQIGRTISLFRTRSAQLCPLVPWSSVPWVIHCGLSRAAPVDLLRKIGRKTARLIRPLSHDDFSPRRVASRRACYNVPLRLAVRERLQEAGSSNVLPHGQHRVSALVPTPHHHFPYRVLRTFVHSYPGLADESHHVVRESRFPLPPSLSRALFLSFCLSPSCSFSLSGANPVILLARVADKRHRVHDSLTDDTCVTFHTKICIVNYKRLSEACIFYARVAHIILINPFCRFKCFMIRIWTTRKLLLLIGTS